MSAASPARTTKPSARDRLLAAADELFYAEGVHTVGIDRIIERAGVAKASLYSTFGSKDELVRAYLMGRHERRRQRLLTGLERYDNPRDQLLGVFDILAELAVESGFRGCAFYNANAESPAGSPAEQVATATRAWTRGLFTELADVAGAYDPAGLAGQLVLLYDGATAGARMDRDPGSVATARLIAAALIDAAVPAPGIAVPAPGIAVPAPGVAVPAPGVAVPAPDVAVPAPDVALPAPDVALPAPEAADRAAEERVA